MWLVADFFIISGIIAWIIVLAVGLVAFLTRKGHNIAIGW